ncbi:hypothetical protein NW766_001782, partial [Fusarium irregulare]
DKRVTQRQRKQRVNVTLLQYSDGEVTESDPILNAESLLRTAETVKASNIKASFNLFVVEDLSSEVIETLGSTFGIDPRFFRAHIIDYAWNNVRDRWREPPILDLDARKRDWFQLRLIRSRYFSNQEEFGNAKKEIDQWNVFRRMDADNNEIFWDKDVRTQPKRVVNGTVGHIRSRITFWRQASFGVVLLDPTLRAGYPLWRGYASWYPFPQFPSHRELREDLSPIPPSLRRPKPGEANDRPEDLQGSLFNDFIFWAQHTPVSQSSGESSPCTPCRKPLEVMLRLVCAEWLTFTDYINTRLNQIDWGIGNPGFFPDSDSREQSLQKLHFWRRWTSQSVDIFRRNMRQIENFQKQRQSSVIKSPFKEDFDSILSYLNGAEQRVTNLGAVVNSAIGLEDARNTSKLTVLASAFVPPSLLAAILSMNTEPLSGIYDALFWWAVLSVAGILTLFGSYYVATRGRSGQWKGQVRQMAHDGGLRWNAVDNQIRELAKRRKKADRPGAA